MSGLICGSLVVTWVSILSYFSHLRLPAQGLLLAFVLSNLTFASLDVGCVVIYD